MLSVSYIYDKGMKVKFMSDKYTVTTVTNCERILTAWRNIYVADSGSFYAKDLTFLSAQDNATKLLN